MTAAPQGDSMSDDLKVKFDAAVYFRTVGALLQEPAVTAAVPYASTWVDVLNRVGAEVAYTTVEANQGLSSRFSFAPMRSLKLRFWTPPEIVLLAYLTGKSVADTTQRLNCGGVENTDRLDAKAVQTASDLATAAMLETARHLCMAARIFSAKDDQ